MLTSLLFLLSCTQEEDCWLVLDSKGNGREEDLRVVDVTNYLQEHPGGSEVLVEVADKDFSQAVNMFKSIGHSSDAMSTMQDYVIGTFVKDPTKERSEGEYFIQL